MHYLKTIQYTWLFCSFSLDNCCHVWGKRSVQNEQRIFFSRWFLWETRKIDARDYIECRLCHSNCTLSKWILIHYISHSFVVSIYIIFTNFIERNTSKNDNAVKNVCTQYTLIQSNYTLRSYFIFCLFFFCSFACLLCIFSVCHAEFH